MVVKIGLTAGGVVGVVAGNAVGWSTKQLYQNNTETEPKLPKNTESSPR